MFNKKFLSLLLLMALSGFSWLNAAKSEEKIPAKFEENKFCFRCHSQQFYTFDNTVTEKSERKAMNPNFVYNPQEFYKGVHRNFACTDCHSSDYETFPHDAALRLEQKYVCMDCHGGDPEYESYHFEAIEVEFNQSVHATRHSEDFTCWMCHDPHSYRPMTHSDYSITDIVTYHNNTCKRCHNNSYNFQRISDSIKPALETIHNWLPNFELHFSAVRCIECHTSDKDTLWVHHQILPKKEARRNCVECHSSNTILLGSLYKYQNIVARKERGFVNSVILNEAYIIGANRNEYVNILSFIIFGLTLGGILIHIILRILKK